jgi:NAD(P)-dependent dehydrogenase (short-subunit alcohol dehydrogenase family)
MDASQTILITGATAGIGRHTAIHFARAGRRVIATGRNREALARLQADAAAPLDVVRLDVTDPASIAEAAAEVTRITDGHGVDVLINNAGYGLAAPLAEVTDEDLRAQFETNVFGLMAVTRAFLPAMRARGKGRIINVSSVGGRMTFPLFGAYHASKYAVEALSDALRLELAPFGIDVVVIEPGPIRTEFAERAVATVEKYRSDASPYAPIYARTDEIKRLADGRSVGPEHITRVMARAIDARRPSARYVAPFSSRLMLALFLRLPTRWLDGILRRVLGLTRSRVLLA